MPPLAKPKQEATTKQELPKELKPYAFYGVDVNYKPGEDEAPATCPFCSRENKFSLVVATGQWRCVVCGTGPNNGGGGLYDFLELLWKASDEATQPIYYSRLAEELGLEYPETLIAWGVSKNILNGQWLVPAWGIDSKGKLRLMQLYQYTYYQSRWMLMVPKDTKHQLLGLQLYDDTKPDIYVNEGWKDGLRLWEVLRTVKFSGQDGKLVLTGNPDSSLLTNANVLVVPSASTFNEGWARWFNSKQANLMYDNDHPRVHPRSGSLLEPAGYLGMRLATSRLSNTAGAISMLHWGADGYDPNLPDGFDTRDWLKTDKLTSLPTLLERVQPVPDDWIESNATVVASGDIIQCKPCEKWSDLILAWRKALKWTDGLDHALACTLAAVASTAMLGDQLWMKIIGPPACGKSTLAEALTVNKNYTRAKSTMRGFHSGFKNPGGGDDGGTEELSLIDEIRGKTFITKDGDTLLQSPNLPQILSEGRDLYDCVSRTSYRNGMGKDYEGIRMTWLLYGTASLRALDSSELGERFLDCVIMHDIDPDLEDEILERVANKAAAHVDIESNEDDATSQYSPELLDAMELTGGYINWLRENGPKILPTIEFSTEAKQSCKHIGKFVAYMRARPSKTQREKAERELAARLVSQHVRLAKCLALVLNRPTVDGATLARVKRVGLDTARGVVFDLAKALFATDRFGIEFKGIQLHANCSDTDLFAMLTFLRGIKAIELFQDPGRKAYRLTPTVQKLFGEATGEVVPEIPF